MPKKKDLKRLVRTRMGETGENYTQALTHVRFSALLRAWEVTDWAGLWLRVDGPSGILRLDNMQDRPLRQTTDWTEASIVLDVAPQAMELHFGALLSGPGAVDLARPRFEEVGEDVPLTIGRLPDEPQALDFGQES
jgi:hypothetical protein